MAGVSPRGMWSGVCRVAFEAGAQLLKGALRVHQDRHRTQSKERIDRSEKIRTEIEHHHHPVARGHPLSGETKSQVSAVPLEAGQSHSRVAQPPCARALHGMNQRQRMGPPHREQRQSAGNIPLGSRGIIDVHLMMSK